MPAAIVWIRTHSIESIDVAILEGGYAATGFLANGQPGCLVSVPNLVCRVSLM
jgi:hypothetical protein